MNLPLSAPSALLAVNLVFAEPGMVFHLYLRQCRYDC